MFYIAGVVLVIAMVNDIKKLGLERGGPRWETLGRFLYLGVFAVFTVYLAFKNVLYGYLSLGVFLAVAGFVLFTRYGNVIKKYTVFQEKYLPLVVIITSISIILVKILFF